ncbi:MAG: YqgE/AlgH family protein [Acidobacteria bacterium]|nr:YqgE/AlgH family protein [Acidobacteriota bacterium]
MLKFWHPIWVTAVLLGAAIALPAQSVRVSDLAAGKLLVARPDATDSSFAETVILLVEYDEHGAFGLVINRRTKVPISRVLQQLEGADNWSDPVYVGGPVAMTGVLALLRSRDAKPEELKPVLGDIYLVSSKPLLEKFLAEGPAAAQLHVYLGYSGWGAGQLENEVNLGAWYIFDGKADLVFDANPASLWGRLIARTEQRYVNAPPPLPKTLTGVSADGGDSIPGTLNLMADYKRDTDGIYVPIVAVAAIDILGVKQLLLKPDCSLSAMKVLSKFVLNASSPEIFKDSNVSEKVDQMFEKDLYFGDSVYLFAASSLDPEIQIQWLVIRVATLIALGLWKEPRFLVRAGIAIGDLRKRVVKGGGSPHEIRIGSSMLKAHQLQECQNWVGAVVDAAVPQTPEVANWTFDYSVPVKPGCDGLPLPLNWIWENSLDGEVESELVLASNEISLNQDAQTKLDNTSKFVQSIRTAKKLAPFFRPDSSSQWGYKRIFPAKGGGNEADLLSR